MLAVLAGGVDSERATGLHFEATAGDPGLRDPAIHGNHRAELPFVPLKDQGSALPTGRCPQISARLHHFRVHLHNRRENETWVDLPRSTLHLLESA